MQLTGDVTKLPSLSLARINRRVALAQARAERVAQQAVQAAEKETARLLTAGVNRSSTVSSRMSSKGFAQRDPRKALEILRLVEIDAVTSYTFDDLGLTSYKYHVGTLVQRLVASSLYDSTRSAALPATQALRHLYKAAMEIGMKHDPSTQKLLCWHGPQQLLQGRASRGAGIVAANESAKALLAGALEASMSRLEARADAADRYDAEMRELAETCG